MVHCGRDRLNRYNTELRGGDSGDSIRMEVNALNVVDVTWKRATRVWWSFAWRFFLTSIYLGALISLVGFIVLLAIIAIIEVDENAIMAFFTGPLKILASLLIPIPIAVWAMRRALTIQYPDCYITLTPYDRDKRDTKYESAVTEHDQAREPRRAAAA